MTSVLTLIAGMTGPTLDHSIAEQARAALVACGADVGAPEWLAPGAACDIPFAHAALETAQAAVRARLGTMPIDLAAQSVSGRRKRLFVADMDSTMITGESLDELAAYAGKKDEVAALTARAMNGEVDYRSSLRARVAMLKGLKLSAMEEVAARIEATPGARALVQTLRAHGAYTLLVTSGFGYFSSRVRDALGFHDAVSNELEMDGDSLAGTVKEPILNRDGKREALERTAAERGIPLEAALAVGDGANDLDMLARAGLGVAFRAKPVVAAAARVRVDHADLTALLYLQGYRRDEFAG
ncbi:MAG: phosphoserine phosphatase SerB [Alphaproteobacteria bacterium]